jgi:hypothetical protein
VGVGVVVYGWVWGCEGGVCGWWWWCGGGLLWCVGLDVVWVCCVLVVRCGL